MSTSKQRASAPELPPGPGAPFFRWLDLIFPLSTGLLATGLALWATLRGREGGALTASWATAGIFWLGGGLMFLIRHLSRKADYYIGNDGEVAVRLGVRNRPPPAVAHAWLLELYLFWSYVGVKKLGLAPGFALTPMSRHIGATVTFLDRYVIPLPSFPKGVHGWANDGVAVIGIHPGMSFKGDQAYVRSVFMHEMSHVILLAIGVPMDDHHKMFAEFELGA